MSDWDSEIRDSWEAGGLQVPSIAFGEHRKGDGFDDAVLLPITEGINRNAKFLGKGYYEVAQMEPEKLVNPKTGKRDIENPKFGEPRRWEKGFSKGKVMQDTILYLSIPAFREVDLSFDTLVSENYLKRIEQVMKGENQDDADFLDLVVKYGLRRIFITGGSLAPNFRAAVKSATPPPQVGATTSVRIEALEPNEQGGKTKIYAVKYANPTADGLSFVETYMSKVSPLVNAYLLNGRDDDVDSTPESEAKAHAIARADADDEDAPPF